MKLFFILLFLSDSSVLVYGDNSHGMGNIISNNEVLTVNHLVGNKKIITIYYGKLKYEAKLVKSASRNDLAIVRINGIFPKEAYKIRYSVPISGTIKVYAVGNNRKKVVYSYGKMKEEEFVIRIDGKEINTMIFDGKVRPGYSGGAVFDSSGDFRGMIFAYDLDHGYLISSKDCKNFISSK